jgi:hypothetical protein
MCVIQHYNITILRHLLSMCPSIKYLLLFVYQISVFLRIKLQLLLEYTVSSVLSTNVQPNTEQKSKHKCQKQAYFATFWGFIVEICFLPCHGTL